MTEIEKELERFIASGKATTKVNSGRFQTTHVDPLKIAKHFAQWQKEQMIKDAIEGRVETLYRYYVCVRSDAFDSGSIDENKQRVFAGDKVKVIIIKE